MSEWERERERERERETRIEKSLERRERRSSGTSFSISLRLAAGVVRHVARDSSRFVVWHVVEQTSERVGSALLRAVVVRFAQL